LQAAANPVPVSRPTAGFRMTGLHRRLAPFLILATGSRGVFELFPRFPFHERRCGLALGKAVADNMRSAGLLRWKLQGSGDWKCQRSAARCPRGDFMRNLVPGDNFGFVLRGLWRIPHRPNRLSDGGSRHRRIPQRLSSSGSTRRSGLYYFKGARVIWSLECRPLRLVVPKPTPRACTEMPNKP